MSSLAPTKESHGVWEELNVTFFLCDRRGRDSYKYFELQHIFVTPDSEDLWAVVDKALMREKERVFNTFLCSYRRFFLNGKEISESESIEKIKFDPELEEQDLVVELYGTLPCDVPSCEKRAEFRGKSADGNFVYLCDSHHEGGN
jgi:hypothetical protein